MSGTYSVENIVRVFDDTTGYYFEVGLDDDGLDLITIRGGESIKSPDFVSPGMLTDQARLVGKALIEIADKIDAMKEATN